MFHLCISKKFHIHNVSQRSENDRCAHGVTKMTENAAVSMPGE